MVGCVGTVRRRVERGQRGCVGTRFTVEPGRLVAPESVSAARLREWTITDHGFTIRSDPISRFNSQSRGVVELFRVTAALPAVSFTLSCAIAADRHDRSASIEAGPRWRWATVSQMWPMSATVRHFHLASHARHCFK